MGKEIREAKKQAKKQGKARKSRKAKNKEIRKNLPCVYSLHVFPSSS